MRILLMFLCALLFHSSFAQVSNVEMRGDFADASRLGRLQGSESLPQYSSNNVKGSRYLTETWTIGTIVPVTGNTVEGLLVMFDKQDQNVYIKKKDGDQVILLDRNQLKTFSVNNRFLIAGALLNGGEKDLFYEKLAGNDKQIALYKVTKTKYVKADRTDPERIKKGDFDDEFKDDITYYIKIGDQPLLKIKLSEKGLIKALPTQEKKIKAYLNMRSTDVRNDEEVSDLINFLNQ
ncbi:MAG TPA: hypothetical protein VFQ58_01340 [Flavisolibacter sp.]|nr:hypothetical protein [Flavisolibacter sp.]